MTPGSEPTPSGSEVTPSHRPAGSDVLRVTVGDRISPQALELIVITIDDPLSPAEKDPLRKWRTAHVKTLAKATAGGKLLPLRIVPLSKVSVQDYRESVPLRLDELQQRPFW